MTLHLLAAPQAVARLGKCLDETLALTSLCRNGRLVVFQTGQVRSQQSTYHSPPPRTDLPWPSRGHSRKARPCGREAAEEWLGRRGSYPR
jgi:hypothetical protein